MLLLLFFYGASFYGVQRANAALFFLLTSPHRTSPPHLFSFLPSSSFEWFYCSCSGSSICRLVNDVVFVRELFRSQEVQSGWNEFGKVKSGEWGNVWLFSRPFSDNLSFSPLYLHLFTICLSFRIFSSGKVNVHGKEGVNEGEKVA